MMTATEMIVGDDWGREKITIGVYCEIMILMIGIMIGGDCEIMIVMTGITIGGYCEIMIVAAVNIPAAWLMA